MQHLFVYAGNFKDAGAQSASRTASLSDQITVRQTPVEQSHTAGFDVRSPH